MQILSQFAEYDVSKFPKFVDPKFPEQAKFVRDDSPRVSGLCTRRAGKSYGIGLKLFRAAFKKPGTTAIYVGLTRQTAKEIMWIPVIKRLAKEFNIEVVANETELCLTLPAVESRIKLVGMDKDGREMHKILGQAPSVVIIDEAGSFRVDLHQLCYEMIEPALTDNEGTLALVGTPTDYVHSLFYNVTKEDSKEPHWSRHRWNTTQNPYMADKWAKRLEMLVETNPRITETPGYKRMYLGEWVSELDSIIYKYKDGLNEIDALPKEEGWVYGLGVDLGFNDPTAFTLCAYNEYDSNLYVMESKKYKGLIFSEVASIINQYRDKYNIPIIVVDGANKQGVEEMRQRYSIPFTIAEKQGKVEFIELMNSDYITGKIKLLPDAEPLKSEYRSLIWDDQVKGRKAEHPSCENHCADSALYIWRHMLSYLSAPKEKKRSALELIDDFLDEEAERLAKPQGDELDLLNGDLIFNDAF